VSHLVSWKFVVNRLQLVKEHVIFSLLLRLYEEVDAGRRFRRLLCDWGAGCGGCPEVGRRTLVQQIADHDVLVVLGECNKLASDKKSLAVEVTLAVRVGEIPDLNEREKGQGESMRKSERSRSRKNNIDIHTSDSNVNTRGGWD
jgi:hypothetical protein